MSLTSRRNFLKNSEKSPSEPDDFPEEKENRVDPTSSSRGFCVRHLFISLENTLGEMMGMAVCGESDLLNCFFKYIILFVSSWHLVTVKFPSLLRILRVEFLKLHEISGNAKKSSV